MPYELETIEGEILKFDSKEELMEYVISRLVEKEQLEITGRDKNGELILKAKETE